MVVLDLATGLYFGLNATGSFIWTMLSEGTDRAQLIQNYASHFEITLEVAAADVDLGIEALKSRGLVFEEGMDHATTKH